MCVCVCVFGSFHLAFFSFLTINFYILVFSLR